MKRVFVKPPRRRKGGLRLSATERRRLEHACDMPVEIAPPGWSFVDWAGLVFIVAMVGLAMWSAFT